MKNRALLSAVALCLLVAGCESKKEAPAAPKVADKVVPLPTAAPTAPPASAEQDAKPSQLAQVAPPPPGPKGCRAGRCKVKITVNTDSSGACTSIVKNPEIRGVWVGKPTPQRDVPIVWDIDTQDWEFDAKGIDFAGNSKFKNGQASPNKKSFTWTDVNDDTGKHSYTVYVVNPKTKKTCSKDPWIVNGAEVEE